VTGHELGEDHGPHREEQRDPDRDHPLADCEDAPAAAPHALGEELSTGGLLGWARRPRADRGTEHVV
jgi:hypothetical protein